MDYVMQKAIAEKIGKTSAAVQKRAEALGIKQTRVRTHGRRYNLYTREDAIKLGWTPDDVPANDGHPLVTDKRWLNINEWPETVPLCFQDLED